jgi:hypothetical protein
VHDGAGVPVKKDQDKETLSTLFGVVQVKQDEPETTGPSVNIWSFVNSISEDKNYLYDDDTAKAYTPFTVNKAFSIHIDTLHHASVMNQAHGLDKKMQHDYYYYSLPKKIRRKKWLKKSDEEKAEIKIIEDVANVTQYNFLRARSFWKTLTPAQRKEFLSKYVYPNSKNEKQDAKNHK